jgi:hypothetical protein
MDNATPASSPFVALTSDIVLAVEEARDVVRRHGLTDLRRGHLVVLLRDGGGLA